MAVNQNLPFGGAKIPGHNIHGRRFTRPIRSEQAVNMPLFYPEVQMVYRSVTAVFLH